VNDKNKHVTPPVIFVLEEKMREQQKEIDERDAKIKELENRLSDAIDLLYGSSSIPKETINEILMLEELGDENENDNNAL